jgi:CheY-like chemotaxis protein
MLLDHGFEDGTAVDVLRGIDSVRPFPRTVVITANAGVEETSRLLESGVYRVLSKPPKRGALRMAFRERPSATRLRCAARLLVGQKGAFQDLDAARRDVYLDAYALAGTVKGASRLLGVSRRAVQYQLGLASDEGTP